MGFGLVCAMPENCGSSQLKAPEGGHAVRTIVTGLILMIICLATYAVTAMQNHW
jgi:hypothetical protein